MFSKYFKKNLKLLLLISLAIIALFSWFGLVAALLTIGAIWSVVLASVIVVVSLTLGLTYIDMEVNK